MKLFFCQQCGNAVYFENTSCVRCGAHLGFVPEIAKLVNFEVASETSWRRMGDRREFRPCANRDHHLSCNWMVPAESESEFCLSCSLSRTIPNLDDERRIELWVDIERAKRRLIYSLLRFGLIGENGHPLPQPQFDLLSPEVQKDPVMTGHANGLITLNIEEADPAHREKVRSELDEPYRTLLGHFRHESAHFYWEAFFGAGQGVEEFRRVFGDEREDYQKALEAHYAQGPQPGWEQQFVTAYAASHPWEDWAETWAHYFHIVDLLETALHFGINLRPDLRGQLEADASAASFDPYTADDFPTIVDRWLPITLALNSLNRSIGQPDAYPFVLSSAVTEKLAYIHRLVRERGVVS
ncbi:MAG: putative zinc-binding peptidase [Verrucomicrobiota bacterium JB022]|nr:putative zinc-binding peptidase [Verrucomicrobiota bacterium JB022]